MSSTSAIIRIGLLTLLTLTNTATIISLRYSMKNKDTAAAAEGSSYCVTALILTMESFKLIVNLSMLIIIQMKGSVGQALKLIYDQVITRPYDTFLLAIPSSLYVLQDNLIIFALSCLDAGTYQVTYQLRILTTAFFARLLLKRQLKNQHWCAIVCLMVGVIITQLNFDHQVTSNTLTAVQSINHQHKDISSNDYYWGLCAVCCASLTSGFAGVFNEKLLKDGNQASLFIRSIQLGMFSILFAAIVAEIKDGDRIFALGFFYGFDSLTWFIVFIQATGGLVVAATMKYADNILKTFATSISIVVSCLLSFILLGDLNLTPNFVLGASVIILATVVYARASSHHQQRSTQK